MDDANDYDKHTSVLGEELDELPHTRGLSRGTRGGDTERRVRHHLDLGHKALALKHGRVLREPRARVSRDITPVRGVDVITHGFLQNVGAGGGVGDHTSIYTRLCAVRSGTRSHP